MRPLKFGLKTFHHSNRAPINQQERSKKQLDGNRPVSSHTKETVSAKSLRTPSPILKISNGKSNFNPLSNNTRSDMRRNLFKKYVKNIAQTSWPKNSDSNLFYKDFAERVGYCKPGTAESRLLINYTLKSAPIGHENLSNMRRPMSPHDQKGFAYHRDFKNVKLLTHMTSALTKVLSLKHTHPIPCAHQGIKETLSYRADFIEPSSLETIKQELDLCNNNCIISVDGLLPKSELIDNDSDTLSSIGHAKNQASAIEALFQKLRQSGAIPSALPLVGTVDIKGQMVLLVDNVGALSHNDHFTKLIARSGLTPPMNQARAQFAQLAPEEMPLPHKNLTSQQRQPKSVKYYKNIHAFLNSTNIRSLMLASTPGNAKSIRNSGPNLLASATAKMILGLSKMIVEPLDPSVQASLKRIDELVKHSLTTSSFKEFSFYHELLHEEILFLLDKSRPYPSSRMDEMSSPHATFEEAYLQSKQALKRLPHRTPNVLAFNSCMACVDALIKAEVRMLGRPPKIAGLQGSYFEITDHFREDVKAQPDQSPSFISADHTLQDIKGLVDMLFLEVHPCANPDATEYQRNPVETIIKTALAKQSGNRLTVALDATLDKVDSKELMRLIDAFEAEVNSGALDIVIYRSAQKFDQLGVDRINAGYMEVYSENTLGDACKSVGGGLEGADYQMLTHLHAHAHAEIHQFQWLHSRWREIAAY